MQLKKCILIAPLVSHATAGRIAALAATGYQVTLIDISGRDNTFSTSLYPYSLLYKIHRLDITKIDKFYTQPSISLIIKDILRSFNALKENTLITDRLKEILSQDNPDIIVTFYGPLGIHFSRLIKKINAKQKVVFIANLLPSTVLSGNAIIRCLKRNLVNEFIDFIRWIKKLDTIVCASDEMAEFIVRKFKYPRNRLLIAPDYHPASFQVNLKITPKISFKPPSLIFLGAPERWGGRMDNIDKQLNLYSSLVAVYASVSIERDKDSIWHAYPYFTDEEVFSGKLSDYAHGFAAALVTYNITRRSERFRTTLPTRFFSALAAGLPIALKWGLFDAVESFITKRDIGFVFYSEQELFEKLNDSDKLKQQKETIVKMLSDFSAEKQAKIFKDLFDGLLFNKRI
ncbi:hypothetical protein [Daejeonella sp.]|uniref:hypothetical protein n=1 Tax=Daejeonella sp. TaxID=2805397 RepID=UPI002C4AD836|nr:hypothetical protein [Daejeonella sp.]HQT24835.1 hypothetical protein [Daejeonella sp.]